MCVVGGHISLTVPRHYTALAGELLVVFSTSDDSTLNDTDWYIDVIQSRDLSPLTTVDIPGGYSDGEVSIGCGVIDAAGQLAVRLVDSTSSDVVAQSNIIDVTWPSSIALRLPDSHKALSEDLVVTLSVEHIKCQSQDSHVSYTLQLIYLGVNASSPPHNTVVFQRTLVALTTPSSPTVVPCSLLDRAGLYQAVLTSSRGPDLPVVASNVVVVDWSHSYSLSSFSLSKSCRQHVVVRHSQPRCHDVFYTVRVLVRQLPSNNNNDNKVEFQEGVSNDVTSRDWRYVSERRVKSSRTSVSFSCSLFQRAADTTYIEHCVLLLSRATDDSVHVHQRFCASPYTHLHTGQTCSSFALYFNNNTCLFITHTKDE